jgi:hypothetical protein
VSVTIDQLLLLAGRLDDAPGFDSPRERFRRFLVDHARTPQIARPLIEACQHTPGEQHHRALQDLVVLLGRFLGFDAMFGTYLPVAGAVRLDGQWQSRSRLHVVVELPSDHGAGPIEIDTLLRSVTAVTAASGGSVVRAAGLCVLAASFVGRHRVEEAVAAAEPAFPVGVIALQSLLSLADMVAAGGVTHDDVVRLLELKVPPDFVVGLLERNAASRAPAAREKETPTFEPALPVLPVSDEPGFWIATVVRDYATRPEEFLELVVGRRQIFGIANSATPAEMVGKNDWICFYIPGKGVVGHAQVVSLADRGSIREAHRFRQLLNIEDVKLHLAVPVPLDAETELRLRAAAVPSARPSPTLVRITRESFEAFSRRRDEPPRAISAGGSRSSD